MHDNRNPHPTKKGPGRYHKQGMEHPCPPVKPSSIFMPSAGPQLLLDPRMPARQKALLAAQAAMKKSWRKLKEVVGPRQARKQMLANRRQARANAQEASVA